MIENRDLLKGVNMREDSGIVRFLNLAWWQFWTGVFLGAGLVVIATIFKLTLHWGFCGIPG